MQIRKACQEAFVIGCDSGNSGLLEHDFRDPDGVRVTSLTPLQVALVHLEPAEKVFAKLLDLRAGKHSDSRRQWFRRHPILGKKLLFRCSTLPFSNAGRLQLSVL